MENQFKSYRTTTSFSAISSLPFNRIRVVDPKTDEDWTEKLVEMSRIEAEKSRLEEEKSRLPSPQAPRQRVFLDPSSREPRQRVLLSGRAKERRAEKRREEKEERKLAAAELRKAKKLIWRADYKRITVDDAREEDSDSDSDQELGGMDVDINNNSNQSKKRMTGRELLAIGAVTSHIPEVERFPTEGNILILLIPRETPLQTIEEALSAMLEKIDLNGPTVQRVCLTCYLMKSPVCRLCDLQSRRPVSETTSSASLTAKPPSIRVSDPNTKEDLTEHFAEMRERREREAEESRIQQHMNASDYELMNAPAAREMAKEFLELRSKRARQDELLRQEKRERQLRRVMKNGLMKKKSRTYVLLMSSMYGKWMHNISGEWTISA